jgi:hypothetical protein
VDAPTYLNFLLLLLISLSYLGLVLLHLGYYMAGVYITSWYKRSIDEVHSILITRQGLLQCNFIHAIIIFFVLLYLIV